MRHTVALLTNLCCLFPLLSCGGDSGSESESQSQSVVVTVYKAIGKVLEEEAPRTAGEWAGFLGKAQRAVKEGNQVVVLCWTMLFKVPNSCWSISHAASGLSV